MSVHFRVLIIRNSSIAVCVIHSRNSKSTRKNAFFEYTSITILDFKQDSENGVPSPVVILRHHMKRVIK